MQRIEDDKILLQLRDGNTPSYPNMWGLPGGAIEEGETALLAVLREIKEETDFLATYIDAKYLCDVEIDQLRGEGRAGVAVYLFRFSNPWIVCLEGKRFEWKTADEIQSLQLAAQGNRAFSFIRACLG